MTLNSFNRSFDIKKEQVGELKMSQTTLSRLKHREEKKMGNKKLNEI